MMVTLVAVMCTALANATVPVCVEEIVTDTSLSEITWQECLVHGQLGIAKWQSEHLIYRSWKVQAWKCAPGQYYPHGKA